VNESICNLGSCLLLLFSGRNEKGEKTVDFGFLIFNGEKRLLILNFGFWILDFGFWILDFGFWILDFGFLMGRKDC